MVGKFCPDYPDFFDVSVAAGLSGDSATPWLSDWYASPDFFDLPAGTGLLVDMGRTVTIASVQVSLNGHGAGLQLPPDGAGNHQASVYPVTVKGQR